MIGRVPVGGEGREIGTHTTLCEQYLHQGGGGWRGLSLGGGGGGGGEVHLHVRSCTEKEAARVVNYLDFDTPKRVYFAGMLNHGVLDLHTHVPGLRSRPLLTTTVTWMLRVCMLDVMFDDNFELQHPFLRSSVALRQRFRTAAVLSALLSPFMLLFLLMHFLLKHLERIYHHPSSLGALFFHFLLHLITLCT